MALSAKERILKLRETEYKLQQLHNDLLSGETNIGESMTEFLAHHNELMALPGKTKDTIAYRVNMDLRRYKKMKKPQKLTPPPKLDAKSREPLKKFKAPTEESDRSNAGSLTKIAPAISPQTLAYKSYFNDRNNSNTALGYPALNKFALSNKLRLSKNLQALNSKRYVQAVNRGSKVAASKQRSKSATATPKKSSGKNASSTNKSTSLIYLRARSTATATTTASTKNGTRSASAAPTTAASKSSTARSGRRPSTHAPSEESKPASATASILLAQKNYSTSTSKISLPMGASASVAMKSNAEWKLPKDDESVKLKEDLAYGVGMANLLGVILPQTPSKRKQKDQYGDPSLTSYIDEIDSMSAKDAITFLRKRRLPERKQVLPAILAPHERGLIGVEISEFLPQCSFFYRDRKGNYNPHLPHSKNVIETMKRGPYSRKLKV